MVRIWKPKTGIDISYRRWKGQRIWDIEMSSVVLVVCHGNPTVLMTSFINTWQNHNDSVSGLQRLRLIVTRVLLKRQRTPRYRVKRENAHFLKITPRYPFQVSTISESDSQKCSFTQRSSTIHTKEKRKIKINKKSFMLDPTITSQNYNPTHIYFHCFTTLNSSVLVSSGSGVVAHRKWFNLFIFQVFELQNYNFVHRH